MVSLSVCVLALTIYVYMPEMRERDQTAGDHNVDLASGIRIQTSG